MTITPITFIWESHISNIYHLISNMQSRNNKIVKNQSFTPQTYTFFDFFYLPTNFFYKLNKTVIQNNKYLSWSKAILVPIHALCIV